MTHGLVHTIHGHHGGHHGHVQTHFNHLGHYQPAGHGHAYGEFYEHAQRARQVIRQLQESSSSQTKTMTKENEKSVVGDDIHSGVHRQCIRYTTGHKHHKHCVGSYIKYMQDHTYLINGNSGNTFYTDLFSIGSLAQWEVSSTTAYGAYQNYQSFLSLNPGEKITGSSLYTAGTIPANDRMFLKNCTTVMDVTNLSTLPVYCKLHIYMAKRDLSVTPSAAYALIANASELGQPGVPQNGPTVTTATFGAQTGSAVASLAGGGATGAIQLALIPGLEFAAYKDFNKLYKTLHTHTFELSAGGSDRIHIDGLINMKHVETAEHVVGTAILKGTIIFTLEQTSAVAKITTGTTGAALVCHGSTELAVVVQNYFKVQPMSVAESRLSTATIGNWEPGGASVSQVDAIDSIITQTQA